MLTDSRSMPIYLRTLQNRKIWVMGFATHHLRCIFGKNSSKTAILKFFKIFHFFKKFQIFAQIYPNLAKFADIQIDECGGIRVQNTSELVRLKALDEFYRKTILFFP